MKTKFSGGCDHEVTLIGLGRRLSGGRWISTPFSARNRQEIVKILPKAFDWGGNFSDQADIYHRCKKDC